VHDVYQLTVPRLASFVQKRPKLADARWSELGRDNSSTSLSLVIFK
jgi:hypothetical protein